MTGEHPGYRAYLLRLWHVRSGGQLEWRASLEDARSGERHGFATLDLLITYLWQPSSRTDHPDEELPSNGAEQRATAPTRMTEQPAPEPTVHR